MQTIKRFFFFIWSKLSPALMVLSSLVKTTMVLFPAFLFLIAAYMCFWNLSQGKDVLIDMLEKKWIGGIVLLSVIFWVMATWYSSRIIIYRKEAIFLQNKTIAFHMPRLMGFMGFSIIWIALLSLPADAPLKFTIPIPFQYALLAFSIGMYIILDRKFGKFRDSKLLVKPVTNSDLDLSKEMEKQEKKRFIMAFTFVACLVAGILVLNTIINWPWLKVISIIALQVGYLFVIVIRRGRVPEQNKSNHTLPNKITNEKTLKITVDKKETEVKVGGWEKFLFNNKVPVREKYFFRAYNYIAFASLIVYLFLIFHYPFSTVLGSFATVLIGFGILVGFFSLVTFVSIVSRINFHLFIWILILSIGYFKEPHKATLIDAENKQDSVYKKRQNLYEYFESWVQARKPSLEKDSSYPMFFVLSDGGASRSGYWSSSVLSKLEDTTNGNFSKHLFCLSGASGGSVGNGTFLALLINKSELKEHRQNFVQGTQEFLSSDFLTYTAARTLGPDIFKPMIPISIIDDRAAALEHAIETGEKGILQQKFALSFSKYLPLQNDTASIPIIGINTTRMQDGRPAVISSIQLDYNTFGERMDVLKELKKGKDIKLSTAVVMGARFPYLSPAGRIDDNYYVDGGYFDNSGAGFVNEMMIGLKNYIEKNKVEKPYLSKLKFYVIHAQNGYYSSKVNPVHPVVNDLAAPLLTLFGTYGTQTSVNDWRMQKYMDGINPTENNGGYWKVNLYDKLKNDTAKNPAFPMNWVISNYYLTKMNERLNNEHMKSITYWIKNELKL